MRYSLIRADTGGEIYSDDSLRSVNIEADMIWSSMSLPMFIRDNTTGEVVG